MRSRALRAVLVVIGLAAFVYGLASLTGGWLGTPPWWEREERWTDIDNHHYFGPEYEHEGEFYPREPSGMVAREGREWISSGVEFVGLALVAFALWPRRRAPRSPPIADPTTFD